VSSAIDGRMPGRSRADVVRAASGRSGPQPWTNIAAVPDTHRRDDQRRWRVTSTTRPRRLRGLLAVPALVVGVLLGTGTVAQAHTALQSTDPADGSTVTDPLPTVDLTFSSRVFLGEVTVTGPAGDSATAGTATVEGAVVTQPVALAAPGAYTVAYEVTSDDGHPLEGQLTFTYAPPVPPTAAGPATPSTPVPQAAVEPSEAAAGSASPDADGLPGWVPPTAAAVVLAAVAGFLVVRRRAGR
jgi:methionine-rich copper-binding protein CopC